MFAVPRNRGDARPCQALRLTPASHRDYGPRMSAAVLTIGTEITRGEIVDTNAAWLAARLTALGFEVLAVDTVDDDRARIVAALRRLTAHATCVVIATGGLGPTTRMISRQKRLPWRSGRSRARRSFSSKRFGEDWRLYVVAR